METYAAARNPQRFEDLADAGLKLSELGSPSALPKHAILIDLIPPLPEPENTMLRTMIGELEPTRVVYISSTGVYGEQVDVDQTTTVKPSDERGWRRLEDERWVSSGQWSSLILRAAATAWARTRRTHCRSRRENTARRRFRHREPHPCRRSGRDHRGGDSIGSGGSLAGSG